MKVVTAVVKKLGRYAAVKSVNSASFFYSYQEKESKEVREALKKH